MRRFNQRSVGLFLSLAIAALFLAGPLAPAARAQVSITSPTQNEDVRGEITVRFEGIPGGGYAMIYMDGKWQQAIYTNSFSLNTFPPNFPGDGPHTIKVVGISAGRSIGEAQVTFNVANNKISDKPEDRPVRLVVWTPADMVEQGVLRYMIFAESMILLRFRIIGVSVGARRNRLRYGH